MMRMRATVAPMHEQMQHGTEEEQHIRQDTEDVCAVFHDQEKCGNG
jgi:hypothetical protein